jgi:lipopolysaccharide/colanic/teichoic acid biosynthesis glycosyltransferase
LKASLVGPKFQHNYLGLYLGRTGLTGLWFTEGLNEDDKEELEKLDIFYAKNQSIWLDLDILGKTFSKMLLSRSYNG